MIEEKEKLKAFISRFFRKHEIEADDDIFQLGFVNSLFSMQIVMFLEKEFSIRIESTDMDLDNFRTINKMIALIQKKRAVDQQA